MTIRAANAIHAMSDGRGSEALYWCAGKGHSAGYRALVVQDSCNDGQTP